MGRLNPYSAYLSTRNQPRVTIFFCSLLATLLLAVGLVAFPGVSAEAVPEPNIKETADTFPQQTQYDPTDPGGSLGPAGDVPTPLLLVIGVIGAGINIWLLIWIYRDAEERGKSGIGWLIFVCICGLPACLIWLLVRPKFGGSSSSSGGEYARKGDAMNLGHSAGETGVLIPKGSEAVEHSLFKEGGYFSTHKGFADEDDEYEYEYEDETAGSEDDPTRSPEGFIPTTPGSSPPGQVPPPPPPDHGPDFPDELSTPPIGSVPPALPEEPLAAPKLHTTRPRRDPDTGVEIDLADDMATIACPGCSHQFKVASTGGMQTITCPACGLSGDVEV